MKLSNINLNINKKSPQRDRKIQYLFYSKIVIFVLFFVGVGLLSFYVYNMTLSPRKTSEAFLQKQIRVDDEDKKVLIHEIQQRDAEQAILDFKNKDSKNPF